MGSASKSTLHAFRWSAVSSGVQFLTSLVVPLILARLLSPEIFGLLAMATVFTGISQILADFGTGDAIIQKNEIESELLDSIVWFNLIIGGLFYFVLWGLSGQITLLFDEPQLQQIVRILGLVVIIQSLRVVPVALLKKQLDFISITVATIVASIVSSVVAISMALLGYEIWSLVTFALLNSILYTVVVWRKTKYRPSFYFSIDKIRSVFGFSAYLTGARFLNYFERQSDKLVVGYFLGSQQLGFYSRGYSFLVKPIKSICGFVNPVVYSSMAKSQNDKKRLQSLYVNTTQALAMVFFPSAITLMFFSESIVRVILGPSWMGLATLLPVFALVLIYKPLYKILPEILKTLNKTKTLFKLRVIYTPLFILGFLVGAQFGVYEVAISYALLCFVLFINSTIIIVRSISLPIFEVFKVLRNVFMRTVILAIFYLFCFWCSVSVYFGHEFMFLVVVISAGVIIYSGLHIFFPFDAFKQLLRFINIKKFTTSFLRS